MSNVLSFAQYFTNNNSIFDKTSRSASATSRTTNLSSLVSIGEITLLLSKHQPFEFTRWFSIRLLHYNYLYNYIPVRLLFDIWLSYQLHCEECIIYENNISSILVVQFIGGIPSTSMLIVIICVTDSRYSFLILSSELIGKLCHSYRSEQFWQNVTFQLTSIGCTFIAAKHTEVNEK